MGGVVMAVGTVTVTVANTDTITVAITAAVIS